MGGAFSMCGRNENALKISVQNLKTQSSLQRPRHRQEEKY